MGTMTYMHNEDMWILDRKAFRKFLDQEEVPEYVSDVEGYSQWREIFRDCYSEKYGFDFHEAFHGKIVGYWYEGFTELIRDLAQFLEGGVELKDEMGEEFCKLTFEDGQVKYQGGMIRYGDKFSLEEATGVHPLPEKEKVFRGL